MRYGGYELVQIILYREEDTDHMFRSHFVEIWGIWVDAANYIGEIKSHIWKT